MRHLLGQFAQGGEPPALALALALGPALGLLLVVAGARLGATCTCHRLCWQCAAAGARPTSRSRPADAQGPGEGADGPDGPRPVEEAVGHWDFGA